MSKEFFIRLKAYDEKIDEEADEKIDEEANEKAKRRRTKYIDYRRNA